MTDLLATGVALLMNMSIEPWHTINDTVMGGMSSSEMLLTDEGLRFQGRISLENNGGFSSVRRLVSEDLNNSLGIRVTLKGDGRSYQIRLREDQNFDGTAWRHKFSTDGTTQVIEFVYPDFELVFRGRKIENAGSVNPVEIKQIGFLISDRIEGEFSLSILKMEILR